MRDIECVRCKSKKILNFLVEGKYRVVINDQEEELHQGIPLLFGKGNNLCFDICMDCGQVQDEFPKYLGHCFDKYRVSASDQFLMRFGKWVCPMNCKVKDLPFIDDIRTFLDEIEEE